jgi:hypothetical protein
MGRTGVSRTADFAHENTRLPALARRLLAATTKRQLGTSLPDIQHFCKDLAIAGEESRRDGSLGVNLAPASSPARLASPPDRLDAPADEVLWAFRLRDRLQATTTMSPFKHLRHSCRYRQKWRSL